MIWGKAFLTQMTLINADFLKLCLKSLNKPKNPRFSRLIRVKTAVSGGETLPFAQRAKKSASICAISVKSFFKPDFYGQPPFAGSFQAFLAVSRFSSR